MATTGERLSVRIPAGTVALDGDLDVPPGARGIVLFAHGSGSGRHSPRNRSVARALQEAGLATLLFDLLTRAEEAGDLHHERNRFDIETLAARLVAATDWIAGERSTRGLRAEVDEVVCLFTPEPFSAVGQWYQSFDQTTDAEVQHLLQQAETRAPAAGPRG